MWHQSWPYSSFLPSTVTAFGDYYQVQGPWNVYQFHASTVGLGYYPAAYIPVAIIGAISSNLQGDHWFSLAAFLSISVAAIIVLLWRRGPVVVVLGVTIFLLSYPTLFAILSGNIEGWIGALLLVTFSLNARGHARAAAVVLGLAIAMKAVPVVFLPTLLVGCNWKRGRDVVLACVGSVVGATLVALVVLPGGLITSGGSGLRTIYDRMHAAGVTYQKLMIDTVAGTHYGNSFLNGIHAFFGQEVISSGQWGTITAMVILVVIGSVFLVAWRDDLPIWIMAALCACAGCLAVPVSGDYRLLYFIPPIMLLLGEEAFEVGWIPGAMILCLIVTPKPWGQRLPTPFTNAGVYVTPLLMMLFAAWVVFSILHRRRVIHKLPAGQLVRAR